VCSKVVAAKVPICLFYQIAKRKLQKRVSQSEPNKSNDKTISHNG